MTQLFPIFLSLEDKDCLVVGGGKVAERKILALLNTGAKVKVVSPEVTDNLYKLAASKIIDWKKDIFSEDDLYNAFVVISATDNENVNKKVARLCMEKNILINVVDDPSKCSFHIPAVIRRKDFSIAISTGGNSPMFAAKLKRNLEAQFGEEYGEYVEMLGKLRQRILNEFPEEKQRRKIFKNLVESDLLELIKKGEQSKVKERIEKCIYS